MTYKPVTEEKDLEELRLQGLTTHGKEKAVKGDVRCRPPKVITDTYFDKKMPQIVFPTVVEAMRAEDKILLWAYVSKKEPVLRSGEFRFTPDCYLNDTTLMDSLIRVSNSTDAMVAFLKSTTETSSTPPRIDPFIATEMSLLLETIRQSRPQQYNRLSYLYTSARELKLTQVQELIQLWRECELPVGEIVPHGVRSGQSYVIYRTNPVSRIGQSDLEWSIEQRGKRKEGWIYTSKKDKTHTLFKKVYLPDALDNTRHMVLVSYGSYDSTAAAATEAASDIAMNPQDDDNLLDILTNFANLQSNPIATASDARDMDFLQSVPKRSRTEPSATVATLTTTSGPQESLWKIISRASSDDAFSMSVALKALYDHGIGGADMRWAASHILGNKLGAKEKTYLFESVKECIKNGKIEEAVEWVKELKSALG